MRIKIGPYKDYWNIVNITDSLFFWQDRYSESTRLDYTVKNSLVNWLDRPVVHSFFDIINERFPRKISVKIDAWDTWSMDHTLGYIVAPMLRQLQETKHGAPNVDDEDVPEELRSTSAPPKEHDYDVDANHFKRWDWVMNEMIWAFEAHINDEAEEEFFDYADKKDINYFSQLRIDSEGLHKFSERKRNAFRLFGKYYQALWD